MAGERRGRERQTGKTGGVCKICERGIDSRRRNEGVNGGRVTDGVGGMADRWKNERMIDRRWHG